MVLEARPLEPLRHDRVAVRIRLATRRGERQAEERERLGVACTLPPIELQAMRLPVAQERIADDLPRTTDVESSAAALGRRARRNALDAPSLALKQLGAQPSEQHMVGRSVFGMSLEAIALEPLRHNE